MRLLKMCVNPITFFILYCLCAKSMATFSLEVVQQDPNDPSNLILANVTVPLISHHIDANFISSMTVIEITQVFLNSLN
jgi:hypothetical protein